MKQVPGQRRATVLFARPGGKCVGRRGRRGEKGGGVDDDDDDSSAG